MTEKEKEELKALDEFLMGKIGITSAQLVGYTTCFNEDTEISMRITPSILKCEIDIKVIIKSGTKIRVIRPCCCPDMKFRSMKDSVIFGIIDPQIVTEKEQLDLRIDKFIEAIA